MGGMSTGQIATVILATGLVIVFTVLILLILIIKLYSTAVHAAQKKHHRADIDTVVASVPESHSLPLPEPVSAVPAAANDISPEIVAAVCAAVYALYGEETPILSVRRTATRTGSRSAWRQAGTYSNTCPF